MMTNQQAYDYLMAEIANIERESQLGKQRWGKTRSYWLWRTNVRYARRTRLKQLKTRHCKSYIQFER